MVLIVTGSGPGPRPGTSAQLTPFTQNAKTSLYCVNTYSLYSSDENTYEKSSVVASQLSGSKSNSRTVASNVVKPLSAFRAGSPGRARSQLIESETFGPAMLEMQPDPRTMPFSNPRIPVPPVNVPAADKAPEY